MNQAISERPRIVAVLDACVLVPRGLRDLLLSTADADVFRPVWQEEIESEMVRNGVRLAVKAGREPTSAAADLGQTLLQMARAFPDARRDVREWKSLVPSMECHAKDRHVLAVAVGAGASHLVTANIKDFPTRSRRGVQVVRPDAFMCEMLDCDLGGVVRGFTRMASRHRKPPHTAIELAGMLAAGQFVARFGRRLRDVLTDESAT